MDERQQFETRRLAGHAMAELCREFGISRKTGHKIFDRYQECGLQGLSDRSRRPYCYANQLFDLSKLAVWWLRLGIGMERIKPRHPQQNGRHERIHLTLKKETTEPAAANFLQQRARFDKFIEVFDNQRPHEALDKRCPAEVYQPPAPKADVRMLSDWSV